MLMASAAVFIFAQTEKETETEAKKYRKFSTSIGNGTIKVKLSKKDALEEYADRMKKSLKRIYGDEDVPIKAVFELLDQYLKEALEDETGRSSQT